MVLAEVGERDEETEWSVEGRTCSRRHSLDINIEVDRVRHVP